MNCQSNSFAHPTGNLVYLNKVYYDNRGTSCPLLYNLTTSSETFTQQLSVGPLNSNSCSCNCNGGCNCGCGNGCNCGCGSNCCCDPCKACIICCNCGNGCNDFTLTDTSTFHITNSYVTISNFGLASSSEFTASDVTIDGFPVSGLSEVAGQYMADLSGIMGDITRCECADNRPTCTCRPYDYCNVPCDNDGHFFLAQAPGPWAMSATIVLEGTVSNGSRSCSFRLCMKTSPSAGIPISGSSNFALYCVDIPCQTANIAPTLVFDFDACANLLSPELTVNCTGDTCTLALSGTLVVTPSIHLQVTKPSLFCLNASELQMPCDDVGQCDPCNPSENCCQCECGEAAQRSQASNGTQPAAQAVSTTGPFTIPACQCCDTNGYSF